MIFGASVGLGWKRIGLKGISGQRLGRSITMMSLRGAIYDGDKSNENLSYLGSNHLDNPSDH